MDVTVALRDSKIIVGHVEVVTDQSADDEDKSLRAAAVAWEAITRHGVFTVNGQSYSAADCAEWWA